MISSLLTVGQGAAAADVKVTPYALINKEVRMFMPDIDAEADSAMKVTDVDGFESRIGIKGSSAGTGFISSADGKIELGTNSAGDSAGSNGRIRIRLANLKLNLTDAGSITLGQDWTPSSIFYIKMDPFSGTVAQNYNLDYGYLKGGLGWGTFKGVGYSFRPFRNQIRYTSPSFGGITANLTYDTSGPHNYVKSETPKNNAELHIAYNSDMLDAALTYATCTGCKSNQPMTDIGVGAKLKVNDLTVGFNWGSQEIQYKPKESDSDEMEATTADRIFVAVDYKMDKMGFSLSHGSATASDDLSFPKEDGTGDTVYKNGVQSLTAVGARYAVSDQLLLRVTLAMPKVASDEVFVKKDGTMEKESGATILAFGAKLAI